MYGRTPFGTIKRLPEGGRYLTRGLRKVKAEAALSVLAFNIIHAVNAFGSQKDNRQELSGFSALPFSPGLRLVREIMHSLPTLRILSLSPSLQLPRDRK